MKKELPYSVVETYSGATIGTGSTWREAVRVAGQLMQWSDSQIETFETSRQLLDGCSLYVIKTERGA
jgi:hypothetical protein